jgi:hypothetical protein
MKFLLFIKFVHKRSTILNIVIGLTIILIFNLLIIRYISLLLFDCPFSSILDLKFSYTVNIVNQLFNDLDEVGRRNYLVFALLIDLPYALFYSFVYAAIILKLYGNYVIKVYRVLFVFPFLITFFDLLENFGIAIMVLVFPTIKNSLVNAVSLCSSLKWISAFCVALVVFTGIIIKLFSIVQKKLYC